MLGFLFWRNKFIMDNSFNINADIIVVILTFACFSVVESLDSVGDWAVLEDSYFITSHYPPPSTPKCWALPPVLLKVVSKFLFQFFFYKLTKLSSSTRQTEFQ